MKIELTRAAKEQMELENTNKTLRIFLKGVG